MTIQDLGSLGEFVASFGVIASLIYLAVQVRQNTHQIRQSINSIEMEAYGDLIGRITDYNLAVMTEPDLAGLLMRAREAPALDALDETRYRHTMMLLFRHADMAYFQHQRGLLSQERLRSVLGPLVDQLRASPRARQIWEQRKPNFVPGLQGYLDALIAELTSGA
jgi:hypothetical protein